MIKRLHIYYKERYPIFLRFLLVTHFHIGTQEIIGSYTVFAFLLWLRVADDLKDHRTDKILFPDRPLAAGKTKIKDVVISCSIIEIIAIVLNLLYMPNFIFFIYSILNEIKVNNNTIYINCLNKIAKKILSLDESDKSYGFLECILKYN